MDLKHQLYDLCVGYVSKKASDIKQVIDDAVDAANNEEKSSAGDKYETGREMMQQEIELNTARLKELNKQKEILDRINPTIKNVSAQLGALVHTNNGWYYLSIGGGQLKIENKTYYAISASSPIGEVLFGKKTGEEFVLNGKKFVVEQVF